MREIKEVWRRQSLWNSDRCPSSELETLWGDFSQCNYSSGRCCIPAEGVVIRGDSAYIGDLQLFAPIVGKRVSLAKVELRRETESERKSNKFGKDWANKLSR